MRTARRGFGVRLRAAALMVTAAAAVVGSGLAPAASAAAPVSPQASSSANGDTVCVPSGEGGTTCTGTVSGDTAYDLTTDAPIPQEPTVTVDQTTGLTNQIVKVSWTNFTPSLIATPAQGFQQNAEFYPVLVEQCNTLHPQSDPTGKCNGIRVGGPTTGAPGTAVESYTQSGTSADFASCQGVPTGDACGTGYTYIQLQTAEQNPDLGCDSTHPCSIVVTPAWGGKNFAPVDCSDHEFDVSDAYTALDQNGPFGTECAQNDTIVVPLSFAPTPKQFCPAGDSAFSAQGSPMLERAMAQWQPGWCTGTGSAGKVDLDYDSAVNEYQARSGFLSGGSALSSSTDVALVTDPASSQQTSGSSRQFTYAPIATTGISIAYYVDSQVTDEPITNLKLDARLVAKLLTQSYSFSLGDCPLGQTTESDLCDPAVAGNPTSIFDDPEFLQLNPEYSAADFAGVSQSPQGGFLPSVLAGDSDMTYELTRWVESDPDAKAFLEGEPDPWGMHVNTYYEQGQTYPVSQFQTLDPGYTAPANLYATTGYPWLSTMQVSWNPVTGVDNIASGLAGWTSNADQFPGICAGAVVNPPCPAGVSLINPKGAPEPFPSRALFAVMDSGTAAAYRFPTAQLVNPAGDAVAPSTGSMAAAVASMKTNPDGITQFQDFSSTSPNAYPLTEVQYAMVPTCGLTSSKASAISAFVQDVQDSQTYGVAIGQIPPFGGYLTLNAAQKQQDVKAAASVQQQTCKSPPPDTTVDGGRPPAAGNGSGSAGLGAGTGGSGLPASPSGPATGAATASASASASPTAVGLGEKAADSSGDVKWILPAALAAGALLAIGGPLAYGFGTAGGFSLPFLRRRTASAVPGAQPVGGDGDGDGHDGDAGAGAGDGSGDGGSGGEAGSASAGGGVDG